MKKMEQVATLPWPRGLCFVGGDLFALARGRPRGAGGPSPDIDDKAGTIFSVSTNNGTVTPKHVPTDPPFRLWDRKLPSHKDVRTDRPYAGLAWHAGCKNFFICCFSGIDKPSDSVSFRKNATDAVLRFDTRTGHWYEVERHEGCVVPWLKRRSLKTAIPNRFFPSDADDLPAGWLNGPDGLLVHSDALYVVGKDNHSLVKYDLSPLLADPKYGPLTGTVLRKDSKTVKLGKKKVKTFDGPSSLATDGESLFVGLRTTGSVLSFPIAGPFDTARLIAKLPKGDELIDMAVGAHGELFVASKQKRIWDVGVPNPESPFQADTSNVYAELPGNCSNIALSANNRLYVCCNVDNGAIFRTADGP